jgi:hypothetical protein
MNFSINLLKLIELTELFLSKQRQVFVKEMISLFSLVIVYFCYYLCIVIKFPLSKTSFPENAKLKPRIKLIDYI